VFGPLRRPRLRGLAARLVGQSGES
jgi:hypothetical protein